MSCLWIGGFPFSMLIKQLSALFSVSWTLKTFFSGIVQSLLHHQQHAWRNSQALSTGIIYNQRGLLERNPSETLFLSQFFIISQNIQQLLSIGCLRFSGSRAASSFRRLVNFHCAGLKAFFESAFCCDSFRHNRNSAFAVKELVDANVVV